MTLIGKQGMRGTRETYRPYLPSAGPSRFRPGESTNDSAIQPGTNTHGEVSGKLGQDTIIGFTISAEDYAVAALDEIDAKKHIKARFAVAAEE